jgi:hypothetical protein
MSDSEMKENYLDEVKQAADIVTEGIENNNLSQISQQLEELSSYGISREPYVFPCPNNALWRVEMILCILLSGLYIYVLVISLGVVFFSSGYRPYGIIGICSFVAVVAVNIGVIIHAKKTGDFYQRYALYYQVLRFKNIEMVTDLATYSKQSEETVVRDLLKAVEQKLIPQGHLGKDNIIFMVSDQVFEQYKTRQNVYDHYFRKLLEERNRM